MANIKSQIKRNRQNEKARLRNKSVKSSLKTAIRKLNEASDHAVTAFLAGFGAHMAVRSVVAVDVNLPTLNDFRITESRRMLAAVARRTSR